MALETPIAFFVFNRPEPTARVFESIARQRPKNLLLISDGPRLYREDDESLVKQTREVISKVDWPCEVRCNFSDVNLGCRTRMATGITWAFEQHEELIILEDDCLPGPSFFEFCEQMLHRYRDQPRVMMISGDHFQADYFSNDSYRFSRYFHIWGWASWRRAWNHYDVDMQEWPQIRDSGTFRNLLNNEPEAEFWTTLYDRQFHGLIDSWDYPWEFAGMLNDGLAVLPNQNLVTNIGFGDDATHTKDPESTWANMPATNLSLPLRHPDRIVADWQADQWTLENIFCPIESSAATLPIKNHWFSKLRRRFLRKSA